VAGHEEALRIRRVIACFAPGHAARPEAVARYARSLEAELLGLFIEDVELLRLASLPFAREVGLASASLLSMSLEGLERQLRAQARFVEDALAAILGPEAGWTFRVERSTPVSAVEAVLVDVEVPVLLLPPGGNLLAERRVVRRLELTPAAVREWLAGGRPVVVLPG